MTAHALYISLLTGGPKDKAADVIARCEQALREAGLRDSEIKSFVAEASAGDYTHLLQTAARWLDFI